MSRLIDRSNRETVRLELSDGEWIDVYSVLTAGESRRVKSAGMKFGMKQTGKSASQTAEAEIDIVEMEFAKVLIRVKDWSFKTADDHKVQLNRENLENVLPADTFDEIVAAIDGLTEAKEKEKNSKPPEGGVSKFIGAGSTVTTYP